MTFIRGRAVDAHPGRLPDSDGEKESHHQISTTNGLIEIWIAAIHWGIIIEY
jgi:hypothetical protein